jgi:hypothetical protein
MLGDEEVALLAGDEEETSLPGDGEETSMLGGEEEPLLSLSFLVCTLSLHTKQSFAEHDLVFHADS